MKQQPRFKTVLMLSCILAVTACNTGKKDDNKSLLPVILALGGLSVGDNYQGGKSPIFFSPAIPALLKVKPMDSLRQNLTRARMPNGAVISHQLMELQQTWEPAWQTHRQLWMVAAPLV